MAIKAVWDLAAEAQTQAGDPAASRQCELNSVQQTLEMRKQVGGASAAAHWTRTAISELRTIQGTQAQREVLRLELRELQEKAQDDFGIFAVPLARISQRG